MISKADDQLEGTMRKVRLGANGPVVSELGLGCMGMSGGYGEADEREARATIHRALELGVTLFDTGDFYGDGANERLLGSALADRRGEAVIATKTGVRREGGAMNVDGSPDYLRRACEASLRRLGVERIDILHLARVDPAVPIEESVGTLGELQAAGKIGGVGLSEVSAETLRRAHAVHPITSLQTEYSLWQRHVEGEILPAARELGVGFVAYSPLSRGLLGGAIHSPTDLAEEDFRRRTPRFQGDNLARNVEIAERVGALAAERGVTTAQLALAWVLGRGDDVVPIPGTKRRAYLEQNVAAVEIELSAEELRALDAAVPPDGAAGERYPEAVMPYLDA
jgi:aryl-alcohol dehydrogenase-like predicted oxidoreductase